LLKGTPVLRICYLSRKELSTWLSLVRLPLCLSSSLLITSSTIKNGSMKEVNIEIINIEKFLRESRAINIM
jgi:hypothetical protein